MIGRIAMAITAIPLLIYPGVLIAGIMGLAAPTSPTADPVKITVAKSFLYLSLLYPMTWGAGFFFWKVGYGAAGQAIAWGNLLLCLSLFAAWYFLSS